MVTAATTAAFRQEIRFAQTRDALRIAYAVSGNAYPLVRAGTWMSNIDFDWRLACFGSLFRGLRAATGSIATASGVMGFPKACTVR